MVTDEQVRLLRKLMDKKKTIATAGMSERSGYAWRTGPLPSEEKGERRWRTRQAPFATVWESVFVPMLKSDTEGVLESKTMLAELRAKGGDAYGPSLLRTLQRRVHEWRTLHGPAKEVMFEQVHPAGREAAFDFTDMTEQRDTTRAATRLGGAGPSRRARRARRAADTSAVRLSLPRLRAGQ
ncbi:MAG: hypothetical protein U0183_20920 [Polyangiaceae bacterium]